MRTMNLRLSRALLATHITFSVGWIGTVAAFLALSITGLVGDDQLVRACYIAMEVIALFIIAPFCIASLLTGLIQALATHWGLFKHYWIVVKLILTLIATIILLAHMKPISYLGEVATQNYLSYDELRGIRIRILADAGAAIFVLLTITTVSVYKPWGKIQFGISLPRFKPTTRRPWGWYLLIGFIVVFMLFIILHLLQGGMHH